MTVKLSRGGFGFVALLLASLFPRLDAQIGNTEQCFAHLALNAGSETSFSIHNPSSIEGIEVQVDLFSPAGALLETRTVEIEAGGVASATFGDAGEALTAGWAKLSSNRPFIATEFIQLAVANRNPPPVGVLPSAPGREVRFFGFVNPQLQTGLAVSNTSDSQAVDIGVHLISSTGIPLAQPAIRRLGPRQQFAAFLEDLFDLTIIGDVEATAIVRSNPTPVAVLTLLQERDGDLVTVPVANRFLLPEVALHDEFEGTELDGTVWDVFSGAPTVADGNLTLAGDAENRADVQSLRTLFEYGVFQASIDSSDWAAQDQGAESDSSFGFELFTGSNGACHYAVLLCSDGHLAVLRPTPDPEGACMGDPEQQAFVAISNWDALRAQESLSVTLSWAPGALSLVVAGRGEDPAIGAATYSGPAIPDIPLGIRLNADFEETYSLDHVRATSIQAR